MMNLLQLSALLWIALLPAYSGAAPIPQTGTQSGTASVGTAQTSAQPADDQINHVTSTLEQQVDGSSNRANLMHLTIFGTQKARNERPDVRKALYKAREELNAAYDRLERYEEADPKAPNYRTEILPSLKHLEDVIPVFEEEFETLKRLDMQLAEEANAAAGSPEKTAAKSKLLAMVKEIKRMDWEIEQRERRLQVYSNVDNQIKENIMFLIKVAKKLPVELLADRSTTHTQSGRVTKKTAKTAARKARDGSFRYSDLMGGNIRAKESALLDKKMITTN